MLPTRFWLVPLLVLGVASCAESQSRATAERPPPWVEFLDGEGIRGWFDTSRVAGSRTGAVDVTLSIDYASVMGLDDDSTAKYTRMDWPLALDCGGRKVQERGMVLFDAAWRENWSCTMETGVLCVSLDEQPGKKPVFWA